MKLGCHLTTLLISALTPACLAVWECTYSDGWGIETTKTCSSGCCQHDCCPFDGALFGGIFGAVLFVAILAACCVVCIRRRRRQNAAIVVMGAPMQTTVTTTVPVGAPVPEHHGYEQPHYQPSSFNNPPPYA